MTEIKKYKMLINGNWTSGSENKFFESLNPYTGEIWSSIPTASVSDVNSAVEAAHHAFSEGPWSKMTPTQRGSCLRKLAELLSEKSEPLGKTETIDTGKMLKETRWQAKYISDTLSTIYNKNNTAKVYVFFSNHKLANLVNLFNSNYISMSSNYHILDYDNSKYDHVIISNMNEGLFPFHKINNDHVSETKKNEFENFNLIEKEKNISNLFYSLIENYLTIKLMRK